MKLAELTRDTPVTVADVAALLSVENNTVRIWRTGVRPGLAFPAPIDPDARPLTFAWGDVYAWAIATGRAPMKLDRGPVEKWV